MVFEFSFPSAYNQLIWPAFRSIRDRVRDEMISLIPLSGRSRSGAIDRGRSRGLLGMETPLPTLFLVKRNGITRDFLRWREIYL